MTLTLLDQPHHTDVLSVQTLWQLFAIGSSNDISGIYKIIAALQQLFAWAALEYRPWFETHVAPVVIEKEASEKGKTLELASGVSA